MGVAGVLIVIAMISVLTLILVFILNLLLSVFDVSVPFMVIWVLVALGLVPAMFWYERRIHGPYSSSSGAGLADSHVEWELATSAPQIASLIELALTGPRWILEALGLRRQGSGKTGVVEEAAEAVKILYVAGKGVPLAKLLRPGDTVDDVREVVSVLKSVDWIGQSSDGNKVWLSSDTKKWLEAHASDLPAAMRPPDVARERVKT